MKEKNLLLKKSSSVESWTGLAASLLTVLIGLVFCFVFLLITSPDKAVAAFRTIITGGFLSSGMMAGIGRVMYYGSPLIMTALSVGLAFKTGVFNIGASGQFQVGGLTALIVAIMYEPVFGSATWFVAMIVGGIAGAFYAMISALLVAYRNVNTVISGIMLNYVAAMGMNWIIKVLPLVYDKSQNWTVLVPDNGLIPKMGLDVIFGGSSANISFFIAILFAIGVWFLLKYTTLGYEMKVCGLNPDAAQYAGINVKKAVLSSMMLAGFLSGIGGAFYFIATSGIRYIVSDYVLDQGFTGICIALLAMSNPIGIIFSAAFITFLELGGQNLQALSMDPEVVNIITGVIVFCCAFSNKIKGFIANVGKKEGGCKK